MKMKCRTIKLVSPYLDGELKEKEKALFEAHLALCPECTRRLEGFRALQKGFGQAGKYRAPYGFSSRVMARVAAEERLKWSCLFPAFTRFAEVAVVLAMITIGIAAGRSLMGGIMGQKMNNLVSSFSLDVFDPAPPDSVGGVYLAMMEARHEK
jgi:anti-sigma factor RsiW